MFDAELDRFKREIHLVEYAVRECGYKRIGRESCRSAQVLRHPGTDDKVVVSRDRDDHWIYFSVRDRADNGSIVDFVQRRQQKNLGEVRKELRDWLRVPRPERSSEEFPEVARVQKDRHAVAMAYAAAADVRNSEYLNSRGLRPETLAEPRFAGTWKEDSRKNVLFVHRDEEGVVGFEIKNRGFTAFATGGTKTVWTSSPQGTVEKLVVAESAIDALSYHQLHAKENARTRYVSTAGTTGPETLAALDQLLAGMGPRSAVVIAADADRGGDELYRNVEALARPYPQLSCARHSPDPALGKDWNAVLERVERDFIRKLGLSRGRGLER